MGTSICKLCGKEFDNNYKKRTFCSIDCRRKYDKQNLIYTEFCKQCGESLGEKGWKNKFCNRSCAAKFNNKISKRKERTCKKCGTKFFSSNGGSKLLCDKCRKEHNNLTQTIKNTTIEDYIKEYIHAEHSNRYSGIRDLCKIWNKNLKKHPCQRCGYSLHTEFCHIKEISKNKDLTLGEINDPSNILILCKNCHWEFDHGKLFVKNIPKRT